DAVPDVALHELPDDEPLVGEPSRAAGEVLPHQRGGPAVVDDRRQRLLQLPGEMGDESGGEGLVLFIDPQEAVAQDKDPGVGRIPVELAGVAPDDLLASETFRRGGALEPRYV